MMFSARRALRRAPVLLLLALATPAAAQADAELRHAIADRGGPREVRSFYAARAGRPLWIAPDGQVGPAAQALLDLIASASLDGLDPDDYRPNALVAALDRADPADPKSLAKAETLLTQSFVALARDMRRPADGLDVTYPDAVLRPYVPAARELLQEASAASDFSRYVEAIGWTNPLYAELRRAAMRQGEGEDLAAVRANLSRLRALPADLGRRFVLVDAAAARLWMYQDGRAVDSMRVVVGKAAEPTPLMVALIRYASLNPYWNLPPDLARLRAAQAVLEQGPGILKTKRFEVLSDWSDNAHAMNPADVDWQAAADGKIDLRVRQLPGPGNAMGRMKFMFPNDKGVYLHDTPEKNLLKETDRLFSSGCVRLEDAPRLGRWLFGKPLQVAGAKPEQRVDLPQPVPVYIVYRTVASQNGQLVQRADVYGRDQGARREVASR